ncbi:bifunctional (p)ppGpp synthetase/guanosine-3',5'-bis(diphosphate) 3'-pyrophosphohydrolase [Candidatus Woesearchaeota archaeon]|nr:bifunctional (p)ppGpp synthetase/guanosine-3',5'-bis(diphosphate) 3'-pyrophosphohydrolase [Candidatus Woesearchaeota archaeon]
MTEDHLVALAKKYCEEYHAGQFRKGTGQPYKTHPHAVAELLQKYGYGDTVTLCIAYLHDIVEDNKDVNVLEIRDRFNYEIANGVYVLSKNTIGEWTKASLARVFPGVEDMDDE